MGQKQVKGDAESPEESDPFLGGGASGVEPLLNPKTNFPLHLAAFSGDLEKVKELLNGSVSVNNSSGSDSLIREVNDKERTPLHCATLQGSTHNLEVIRLLLQRDKEDPSSSSEGKSSLLANLLDAFGKTALHYAAASQKPRVVSLLLEYGADPNLKDDEDGFTPLHILARSNSDSALECAKLILDSTCLSPSVGTETDRGDQTVLATAVNHGAPKLLRLFVERGLDFTRPDSRGDTPLIVASFGTFVTEDNLECARILLDAYSPEQVNAKGEGGKTALMFAQSTKMTKLFVASPKSDLFVKDSGGRTVFHYAIKRKSLPSVKTLCECEQMSDKNKIIEFIFNSHEKDTADYWSPIRYALSVRHKKIVEYLLTAHPYPGRWTDDDALMSLIYSETPTAILPAMNRYLHYNRAEKDANDTVSAYFQVITGCKDTVKELTQETKYIYEITKAPKDEQKLILLHPLVQIFLVRKWERIRPLTWIHIIIQLSWIVSYTLMVYEMYRPNCHNANGGNQTETEGIGGSGGEEDEGKGHVRILTSLGILQWEEDCRFHPMAVQSTALVLYLLSALVLIKEGFQMMVRSWGYFLDYINFLQLGLLVVAVVNSVPAWQLSSASDLPPWQSNLAAIGIFVAWVMLLSELDNFPKCAVYAAIFKTVLVNCLRTMLFYCPLLIGFAMCLRILTPGKGQHNYLLFSLIKVVVMMTGELEFEDAFYGDDNNDTTSGPSTAYAAILGQIIFLVLLVVTTIVLLNLLTGLAVNDVKRLLDDAEVDRHAMQLERMYMFDTFIVLARKKLPCLDSWKGLLFYRWNATSEEDREDRRIKMYSHRIGSSYVIKDFPKELQASIEKAMVRFEDDDDE